MRRVITLALVSLLTAAMAPVARTATGELMLVRVEVATVEDAQLLLGSFDETHNHGDGTVELLLYPGDADRLRALGFGFEVVEADVVSRDRALFSMPRRTIALPGPDRDDYRRLGDYLSEMRDLAKRKPKLARLVRFPNATLEGRPVIGIEIAANVRRADGRPTYYVDGVHHAREWPSGEYPMIFAHQLVEDFGKRARITKLLRRLRVVIVPVVNPDGFDYSREALVDPPGVAATGAIALGLESYWRKNRRSLTGVTLPVAQRNPDAYGVDPNRNYAFLWGAASGSSGEPLLQDYRGEEPFSEPETQNIRELILSRHVTGVITNHTYGRLVLRAWGHTADDAPDERLLAPLGARMARAMGGYSNQKGIGLYATTGTTDDWAYATTGALGFTLEHETAFHPPYAESVGKNWRGVTEAFTIMAEAAADPRNHSVMTGRVVGPKGPVRARLILSRAGRTPLGEGNPTGRKRVLETVETRLRTRPDGSFTWHTNPSTRPISKRNEAFDLAVASPGGCRYMKVRVRRGQRVNLGTIRATGPCRAGLDVVAITG